MSRSRVTERTFALALVATFVLSAGYVALHHEIWRDEMRAWLIARDSATLVDVWRTIKPEGHPMLWYVCLWLISRVTSSPFAMQGFHLALACTTVYVFATQAPFRRLHKVLFAFSYFAFYEYAIVSRHYAVGILLLFLFCTAYARGRPGFLWACVALALVAQSSAHLLILAGCFRRRVSRCGSGRPGRWGFSPFSCSSTRVWACTGMSGCCSSSFSSPPG